MQLEAGFSLIEMMVVLVILAVIAGISIPMLHNGRGGKTAATIAMELQGMFHQARTNAISRGSTEAIRFDLTNGAIAYDGEKQVVNIPRDIQSNLLIGRELIAVDGVSTLLFFPDGGSTGAKVILAGASNQPVNVLIPWLTGVAIVNRATMP